MNILRLKVTKKNEKGFTLIEMVGVLAVVAILGAFIAPKVFSVIEDTKSTRFAAEVNTFTTSVANWYKDIGTLQSLAAAGTVVATDTSFQVELSSNQGTTATTGLWSRWRGPYLNTLAKVPIGTTLTMETNTGAANVTIPLATDSISWDLNEDSKNDMTSKQVVTLKLTGVTDAQFETIDEIIDAGLAASTNATSGKVKYDSTNDILYVYLASL